MTHLWFVHINSFCLCYKVYSNINLAMWAKVCIPKLLTCSTYISFFFSEGKRNLLGVIPCDSQVVICATILSKNYDLRVLGRVYPKKSNSWNLDIFSMLIWFSSKSLKGIVQTTIISTIVFTVSYYSSFSS